jgi:hypothetical protein
MKKGSPNRAARRAGKPEPLRYPEATPDYIRRCIQEYVQKEIAGGRLFDLEGAADLASDYTRIAIEVVFTAIMESHTAGASRILRDIDPLVESMFKDMERMCQSDGYEYAAAKLKERYQKAKKNSYRPIKGLELLGG